VADQLIIALQPKQQRLLNAILDRSRDAPTVLGFGGSRGAAKSGGVRRISLALASSESGIIVWIIRRVWDDLNKDHVQPMFREYPELKQFWRAIDHELRLPNGSSIFFIHAGDSGRAKRKARGPQAHFIFLEQAEEFSQEEMEQIAGSNRAPGVGPGYCKRIYTFNPGGIGTNYLRRIFHLRQFNANERPEDFLFIQGYGWDNYEWFRSLGIVSEWDFYHDPEWAYDHAFTDELSGCKVFSNERRFRLFIESTDFGRKLNGLRPSERIGELMGSFEKFSGQYYGDVWDENTIVLRPDVVASIVKPWWRAWLATDWGFSHYAATGWARTGMMSIEEVRDRFGVECMAPIRVIIVTREAVCSDVPEPDLAQLIVKITPDAERREVRFHFMGHDGWAKRGSANTVVDQMEPHLLRGGLQRLSHADIDRPGGWRLLWNCFAAAKKLRSWRGSTPYAQQPEDAPALFISAACPEIMQAVPMLMADEEDPNDIRKVAGDIADDVADMLRYLIKSYLSAEIKVPDDVTRAETFAKHQDPTARAMAMLRLEAEQSKRGYLRRRARA